MLPGAPTADRACCRMHRHAGLLVLSACRWPVAAGARGAQLEASGHVAAIPNARCGRVPRHEAGARGRAGAWQLGAAIAEMQICWSRAGGGDGGEG